MTVKRADRERRNTSYIQSVERALDVLDVLGRENGMTLDELAEATGLSRSVVYRLLRTLRHKDFVEHDAHAGVFKIGLGAFVIGNKYLRATTLIDAARPVLSALVASTGWTAQLCVPGSGRFAVVVSSAEPSSIVRVVATVGERLPLHATAAGKVLLAFKPQSRHDLEKHEELRAYTERTLVNHEALGAQLAAIRRTELAWACSEYAEGLIAAAVPIFGWDQQMAGSLVVASNRLADGEQEVITTELARARVALERRLGSSSASRAASTVASEGG